MKTAKSFTHHETIIGLLLILALASACTALLPAPTQPPAPTPTFTAPPPTPTHTPAPPAAAELKATVEAGLMPTPTPDASGWSPASITQVGVLPLQVSEGSRPLWAVYSFGNHYSEANQQVITPGSVWATQAAQRTLPCYESFGTGSFTRSLAENAVPHRRGGPSTMTYGIASPLLQFCDSPERRAMWIVSEGLSKSNPYPYRPGTIRISPYPGNILYDWFSANIILYRLQSWPPDTGMIGECHLIDNVDTIALSYGRTLTWEVKPGVYMVYFPNRADWRVDLKTSPVSITYRMEIETSP